LATAVAAAILASLAVTLTVAPARAAAKVPPGFQEQVVYGGLDHPTNIAFSPDGRVFVSEKTGKIVYFNSLSDTTPHLYADLSAEVDDYWDRGLLGLALNPNFPTDPRVYVLYTYDAPIGGTPPVWNDNCPTPPGPNTDGCVVSGRLSYLTPDTSSPTGVHETVLVNAWCQQFPSHSIGTVTFGSDGALYVGGGDGASFTQADIGSYGGTLQGTPTPKNPCGDPPGGVGDPKNKMQPPGAEGGALRAQSLLRQPGEPALLNGTIIRVNPDTGAAMPDNPLVKAGNPDPNAQRIVAGGLRNPFRFAVRPGTNELWIGDVGWNTYDSIDWLPSPASGNAAAPGGVPDFGWPCYEGPSRMATYASMGLSICNTLYSKEKTAGARVAPYFSYIHRQPVTPGEACGTGSSSPTGIAFNPAGVYPAPYAGALFFADYSRQCIWSMPLGASGRPDPAKVAPFAQGAGGIIQLAFGPGGNLYAVDLLSGQIKRYVYYNGNNPPVAAVKATPASGSAPLTVSFDASGSSDADPGDTLAYAWDFGDGSPAGTGVTPRHTYAKDGQYTAQVKVTDAKGASDIATAAIDVGATGPVPHILAPVSAATFKVGDVINYAGSAADPAEGDLPASDLSWDLIIHHCPSGFGCHTHDQAFTATGRSGSFAAPDHAYPSYLELKLTATDAKGYTGTASVFLQPKTVDLTYQSTPAGLQLSTTGQGTGTPYTVRVIQNSQVTVDAASPQTLDGHTYAFSGWSDKGAAFHTFNAPLAATTYTANYHEVPGNAGLVAAYSLKEGSGTTAKDLSGHHNAGIIHNGIWSNGSLAFNGTSTVVTVPDSPSLRLTSGATLEAWVRASPSLSGWRAVAGKVLSPHGLSYALHASDGSVPDAVLQTGTTRVQLNGTTGLPRRQWIFLSAVYSGRRVHLYVNGQQVAVGKASGALSENGGPLQIGGNSALGQYFAGTINEVRVYSRPLAQDEIQADMWTPAEATYPATAARRHTR
jgi:glucose/arabinose dehydrogenase/PKD repeat protein